MKKLLQLVAGICLLALMPVQFASAAGAPTIELSKSKSSVVADGSSSVTITLYAYFEDCVDYDSIAKKCISEKEKFPAKEYTYDITVSGSNNTFPSSVTTGQDGKVSFALKSTTAETKTISSHKAATITVEFTKPVVKAAPKPAPAPPTSPTASAIKADDQAVTDTQKITVQSDKVLTIGGTTVANGVVKLFIFSDPKEATVAADAQGNWTYDISGLESGSHHVEAEVTDPATNLTSQRATLASFTVTEPPVALVPTTPSKKQNFLPYIIAGAVLITAGIVAGIWWYIRKRKPSATILGDQSLSSSNDSTDKPSQPNS